MADQVILYFFKLRSDVTGKWHKTRRRMTIKEARQRHGKGNYEVLWDTREVRSLSNPAQLTAGHLYR
jgi:hypothetical protein